MNEVYIIASSASYLALTDSAATKEPRQLTPIGTFIYTSM